MISSMGTSRNMSCRVLHLALVWRCSSSQQHSFALLASTRKTKRTSRTRKPRKTRKTRKTRNRRRRRKNGKERQIKIFLACLQWPWPGCRDWLFRQAVSVMAAKRLVVQTYTAGMTMAYGRLWKQRHGRRGHEKPMIICQQVSGSTVARRPDAVDEGYV